MANQQQQLDPKQQAIMIGVVVGVLILAIGFAGYMASSQTKEISDQPLSKLKEKYPTHLKKKGPAPQEGQNMNPAPYGAKYVEYTSSAGKLGAWLIPPQTGGSTFSDGKKHPAILWGHGGFAVGTGDIKDVYPFSYAGYVVLIPAWRGENGNPGNFEMCYGEVEDAVAALQMLKSLPEVDSEHIYAGGHSAGATVALLLAEETEDLKAVAACGAYPDMSDQPYDGAPFNGTNIYELACRAPALHTKFLNCPTLLVYGSDEAHYLSQAEKMKTAARKERKKVSLEIIPGSDHFKALGPAIQKMIEFFKENI